MSVAEAVCRLLEIHKSQQKVAELLGTNQQMVSRWASGKVPRGAEIARAVFEALKRSESSPGRLNGKAKKRSSGGRGG